MNDAFDAEVAEFVEAVDAELTTLSGTSHRAEVIVDVADLAAAVMDSDGRHSTAELEGWLSAVGRRLDPPVIVTPQRLREGGLLDGKAAWLNQPSTLFDLLLRADARDGTRRAVVYYDQAMRVAHAVASCDMVPSPDELAAIDRYRMKLLAAFDRADTPRPGQPARPSRTPPTVATESGAGGAAGGETPAPVPEPQPARPLDEILAELDELIGLQSVKTEVRRLTSLLRIQQLRKERELPTLETSHHLVFTGNPGTGKTTVARLFSQILHSLDLVRIGQLVETDRSKLVAGYVGQTAAKTHQVLESALGGTLIIDEAYALARGGDNDFGREAIDTLVKYMEDHRDDLAIIAAGYPAEMTQLIEANPGLASRFTRTIHFPDYTTDELVRIFQGLCDKQDYHLDEAARARLVEIIDAEPRGRGFGNARFVRNVFEASVGTQAERLAEVEHADGRPTDDELRILLAEDLTAPGGLGSEPVR